MSLFAHLKVLAILYYKYKDHHILDVVFVALPDAFVANHINFCLPIPPANIHY